MIAIQLGRECDELNEKFMKNYSITLKADSKCFQINFRTIFTIKMPEVSSTQTNVHIFLCRLDNGELELSR